MLRFYNLKTKNHTTSMEEEGLINWETFSKFGLTKSDK